MATTSATTAPSAAATISLDHTKEIFKKDPLAFCIRVLNDSETDKECLFTSNICGLVSKKIIDGYAERSSFFFARLFYRAIDALGLSKESKLENHLHSCISKLALSTLTQLETEEAQKIYRYRVFDELSKISSVVLSRDQMLSESLFKSNSLWYVFFISKNLMPLKGDSFENLNDDQASELLENYFKFPRNLENFRFKANGHDLNLLQYFSSKYLVEGKFKNTFELLLTELMNENFSSIVRDHLLETMGIYVKDRTINSHLFGLLKSESVNAVVGRDTIQLLCEILDIEKQISRNKDGNRGYKIPNSLNLDPLMLRLAQLNDKYNETNQYLFTSTI